MTAVSVDRHATRQDIHDLERAAAAMHADARGFRAIAAASQANPATYGGASRDYCEGIAARYLLLAEFSEHQAKQQQAQADELRALLGLP